METSLSHPLLVSSMLNADNTAVGSDEMDRGVPSTVKDQPSPTTVGAVRAISTAAGDDLNDVGYSKKMDLSLMNCKGVECISGVGDSNRCTIDGRGMEEGALEFDRPSGVDGAANVVACSSCLDGSDVASGSCLGGVPSSVGELGVEISDSSLARGSDAVGVEGGDAANFCTSTSSSCCRTSVVDRCEGVGGVCFDSEELRSRGVPSCCDVVLEVAGRKVVRAAAAGFKADGTGSMDGMDVTEGAGTIGGPIRDAVNSASGVCETSEAQTLERDPESIPGENPLSFVKSRPWGLPNHAPVSDDPSLASIFCDSYAPEAPASPMVGAATVGAVGSLTPLLIKRRSDKSEIGSVGAEQDAEAEAKPPLRDTEQSALATNGAGETKSEACLRAEEMDQKQDTGGDGHSGFSGSMSPYQGVGTRVRDERMLAEELSNLPAERDSSEEDEKLSEDTGSLGEGEASDMMVTETAESALLDREVRLLWSGPSDSGTSLTFQGSFSFADTIGGHMFCSRGVDCEVSVVEGGSNLEAGDDVSDADGVSCGIGGVDCSQSRVEAEIDSVTCKVPTAGFGNGEGASCVAADPVDRWSGPLERRRKSVRGSLIP